MPKKTASTSASAKKTKASAKKTTRKTVSDSKKSEAMSKKAEEKDEEEPQETEDDVEEGTEDASDVQEDATEDEDTDDSNDNDDSNDRAEAALEPDTNERTVPTFLAPTRKLSSDEEEQEPEEEPESDEDVDQTDDDEAVRSETDPQQADDAAVTLESEDPAADVTVIPEPDDATEEDDKGSSFSSFMSGGAAGGAVASSTPDNAAQAARPGQAESRRPFYIMVGLLTLLIVGMLAVVLIRNNQSAQPEAGLVDQVAGVAQLPLGEEPVTGKVIAAEQLKDLDADLFRYSKDGNSILVYTGANLVVLFDDQNLKVVAMGASSDMSALLETTAIAFDGDVAVPTAVEPTDEPDATPAETVTIELRNGSSSSGLTLSFQSELEDMDSAYEVIRRSTAATTFEDTVVYNLGDSELAEGLAEQLNAELAIELPEGEASTDADVLIILGEDQLDEE